MILGGFKSYQTNFSSSVFNKMRATPGSAKELIVKLLRQFRTGAVDTCLVEIANHGFATVCERGSVVKGLQQVAQIANGQISFGAEGLRLLLSVTGYDVFDLLQNFVPGEIEQPFQFKFVAGNLIFHCIASEKNTSIEGEHLGLSKWTVIPDELEISGFPKSLLSCPGFVGFFTDVPVELPTHFHIVLFGGIRVRFYRDDEALWFRVNCHCLTDSEFERLAKVVGLSLSLLLGRKMNWTGSKLVTSNSSKVSLWHHGSAHVQRFPPPVPLDDAVAVSGLMNAAANYFWMNNDPALCSFLEVCWKLDRASLQLASLTLAIAIEGLSQTILANTDDVESFEISKTLVLDKIASESNGFLDDQIMRIRNKVLCEYAYSEKQKIQLAANIVRSQVTKAEYQSWQSGRQAAAHGEVWDEDKLEKRLDGYGRLLTLFYKLVLGKIGYIGQTVAFGS